MLGHQLAAELQRVQADRISKLVHEALDVDGSSGRRVRQGQQPDRPAHAHLGPVDPGERGPRSRAGQGRTRSRSRASIQRGEHAFGYSIPNLLIDHAMRNPHVPPGFWRGVNINQNAIYVECFMDELAACGRPGRAGVPAQADDQASEATSRCSMPWPRDRLGQAGAAGRLPRPGAHDGVRQLCGGRGRGLGHRRQDQDPPHRRARPIRATRSIRRRSTGRLPARSCTACRRCSTAGVHREGRPHRSKPTSTPTTRCASRRCRRSSRSSMPSGGTAMGRRRRADHLRGGAGRAQRLLQGDRQAHPLDPAEEPQPADRVIAWSGGPEAAALFLQTAGGIDMTEPSIEAIPQAAAASAAAAAFPAPRWRRAPARRVVIIGGGFGGASCARALRKADPRIAVTLVEANPTYTALPHSNAVIAGLIDLKHQQFGYDRIKRAGVTVALVGRDRDRPADADGDARRRRASSPTSGWCCRPASISARAQSAATTASRRGDHAARLERRRAGRAAAPPARSHGGRRHRGHHVAGQSRALPARALRARQPDRALSEDAKSRAPR